MSKPANNQLPTTNNQIHEFPTSLNLRLDWSELDLFGHINNVMFFKYIQASRVNYWETIGLTVMYEETQIGPMLVSTGCQFRKQLHYPGNITVRTRMSFIKTTSFGLQHKIYNDNDELCAEAEDAIVIFDFNKHEKSPFPEKFRLAAEKLENKSFR
jgi:acyl-CoA thioester hydrolase